MTALSRAAYYQALGIDVWIRRGARMDVAQTKSTLGDAPLDETASMPAPIQSRSSRTHPSRSSMPASPSHRPTEPIPEESFRIRCFHYGRAFAALADDAWPVRRILLDVAWAMNDFRTAERRDLVFDWPQPGAVADAGGKAFGAFFRLQIRTRSDTRVLIAGAQVATLLGHSVPSESRILDGRLFVRPGALDASAKRTLWRLIQELGA